MAMHNSGPDELQEQVKRLLELVIHACVLDRAVHRARQWTVRVRVEEEPGLNIHNGGEYGLVSILRSRMRMDGWTG